MLCRLKRLLLVLPGGGASKGANKPFSCSRFVSPIHVFSARCNAMNRGALFESDDDDDEEEDDDGIGEDLEDLRRACIVSESNSDVVTPKSASVEPDGGGRGGEIPSDSENEDDFEMLRSLKSQLASSTSPPVGLPLPSDSESDDDFELLRSLKSQLALSMNASLPPMSLSDDEDDDSFETLRAIRRRFSAYANLGELNVISCYLSFAI